MCTWLCGRLAVIKEPWCPAVFVWTRLEPSAAVAATCGPVRRLAVEIGFGPVSGPWPVWRLAGLGLGTAGFRRFRIDTDCVHLPDHLFPWADSEIEHRNRIRAKENTGISVCPAARLIGDNRRTLVFRRFRMGAVCVRCRTACFRGLIRESDIEIGFDPCMAAQSAVFLIDWIPKALGFRRSRMDTDCVRLPDCLFWWTDSGIGPRNRIRAEGSTGISVCPAVRPAGHHQRTTVFHRFWMDTGGDCLPWGPPSWTSSEIGPRDWIWSVWDVDDWRCDDLYRFREPRYFAVSGLMRIVPACRTACFRGLIRRLTVEIGFGPASGPWPVWRLAGHGLRTEGFSRFRMGADCVRLPDCLFSWSGSGIGCGNPIRSPRTGHGRRHAVCVDCQFSWRVAAGMTVSRA